MLLPIAIGLGALAIHRATRPTLYGVLTEKRKALFLNALNKKDPPLSADQLGMLAEVFDGEGLPKLAEILRKRASLRSMPSNRRAYRAQIFKELTSIKFPDPLKTDPEKIALIRRGADIFDNDSAYGQASVLRDYADGLEAQANMAKMAAAMAPPPASSASAEKSTPTVTGEPSPFVVIETEKQPFEGPAAGNNSPFTSDASKSPDEKDFAE